MELNNGKSWISKILLKQRLAKYQTLDKVDQVKSLNIVQRRQESFESANLSNRHSSNPLIKSLNIVQRRKEIFESASLSNLKLSSDKQILTKDLKNRKIYKIFEVPNVTLEDRKSLSNEDRIKKKTARTRWHHQLPHQQNWKNLKIGKRKIWKIP